MPATNGPARLPTQPAPSSSAFNDDAAQPLDHGSLHLEKDLRLAPPAAGHLERVIAALHDVQGRRSPKRPEYRLELGRPSERVAAPLDEKHRAPDVRQVCVTPLVGAARRVKRVSK